MKNKLIKSKSEIFSPPFNIEKIAKKIKSEHIVKSLLSKYVDPLIKRRSIVFKRKGVSESQSKRDSSYITNPFQQIHFQTIKLNKIRKEDALPSEDFPFSPLLYQNDFPKPRPYELFLQNSPKKEKNPIIKSQMLDSLCFTRDVKVNSIIERKNQSLPDISLSKSFKNENSFFVTGSVRERPKFKCRLSKLEQIAKLGKIYINSNKELSLFKKKENFSFVTNSYVNSINSKECLSDRNKEILEKNSNVSIDCVKSAAAKEIFPEQIIAPTCLKHKILRADTSDRTYQRVKFLDGKIRCLIQNSKKYSTIA